MMKPKNLIEDVNIKEIYGKACLLNKNEFIENFQIKENGLSNEEAKKLIHQYGSNEIKQTKSKKWYHFLIDSLVSPFNLILLGIILLLIYTDIMLPETPSYANIIVIIVLVSASTLLDFFEEYRP